MRIFLLSLLLTTLGNADIVKLVKAGLTAETIEAKIATSDTHFDTSTDALVALADAGVPDRVIRVMIQRGDHVAPTPPRMRSRRYDVTVHAEGGGKCEAEVRIDGKGIKASRCKALDFDVRWNELEGVCYTYGFRGELVVRTKDRERKISTTTPAEAKRLVEHIRAAAPKLPVADCR